MDKIRISVSTYTYDILLKDMDSFEILKKSGEVNKNEFLNRLIINYIDEYLMMSKTQLRTIERIIGKHTDVDEYDKVNLTNEIFAAVKEQLMVKNVDDSSVVISLKPIKESEPIIDFIINEQIENQSISSFFRQMFDSYVGMTQNLRERIIFKDVYNTLIKSLELSKKVFVTFRSETGRPITGSLYCVKDNKEEMFNYCLFDTGGRGQTVRLCHIKSAKIINEQSHISEKLIPLFDFQIENSLAYPVSEKDLENVAVKLDEIGVKMYKKTYLYRPRYYKVENNIYYFKGSHQQIFNYFKRFGGNAIIISPQYLKDKMQRYYKESYNVYKKESEE